MEDQRSFYLRGRVGLVLFYLAPDPQVDEGSYGEASLPGLGRVCVPFSGGPEHAHQDVLGDVHTFGLEGGELGRVLVSALPVAVVVDVHCESGLVQSGHEADHAAVAREHHASSQEVLQLRIDPRLGLAEAVHHQGALAHRVSTADDGDLLCPGLGGLGPLDSLARVLVGHVLSLLRGGAVCTMPMLGRGLLRATERRGCCRVP